MTIDIKAIREAAEAALMDDKSPGGIGVSTAIRYVATANPTTVLTLCDEVERLRKEVERLQSAASDPQLLTSDERRAVGERIMMHIKHGTEYVK